MQCNKALHHRESIRLKEYDYSQAGYYFITICSENKENLFGEIVNQEMKLNHAGQMVEKWWLEVENKFKAIKIDKFTVMPNHFHGILVTVGADLCVCPGEQGITPHEGEHTGSPLPKIMQWFKTMTTNEYINGVKKGIYPPFEKRIWQRNYYEHVIRSEQEYLKIWQYIDINPLKWQEDRFYK